MRLLTLVCGAGVMVSSILSAQEFRHFAFDVGGGFTQTVGNTGRHLDNGWNVGMGVGYNFNPYVGALVQFAYNRNDINGATLANLGFPGGDTQVSSFTLDPIVHLAPGHKADIYMIGGGGLYHRYQEFTTPAIGTFTGFDPFFGFYRFNSPVTQVLSSYSINKPGFNAGMGIGLGSKWHGKFFAEARWHRMFVTSNLHMDIVPVTFGFRW